MMVIKAIAFVGNIIGWLIIDIWLWTLSWCCGLGGVIGIVSFFLGYSVSAGMMLAPRDYWREPNYSIFKRKLMYGNSVAGTVTAIATFVFYILQEL